jgi:hypothetical protein
MFNHIVLRIRQLQQRWHFDPVNAYKILTRDFVDPDSLGLSRVAQFQYNEPNPYLMADVAGCILELLDKCLKVDSRIFSKHSVNKGLLRYSLSDKVS